jgi:glycosyltransferase involved in cell wall biosynthesis
VPKTQVPTVLNSGDIFLNTANVDNTPVSVIEAMACGLCVVSTNIGGLPHLLADEQDSLLVQPDDQAVMATAVSRILRETGLAQRLSRNARAKAEQFDWSNILPQWETLLMETAAAGPV